MAMVYLVSQGSYSSYGIRAVFSTEAAADKYAATFHECMVEPYELDPVVVYPPEGYFVWYVNMLKNGNTVQCRQDMGSPDDIEACEREPYLYPPPHYIDMSNITHNLLPLYEPEWVTQEAGVWSGTTFKYHGFIMCLHVLARDEQHAIKIANEKRTQLIAENKWPGQA
jgi:hypothetical protein